MRILVLGGTRFVGRAIVDQAAANGHDVTIFHRGQTPAEDVRATLVQGDRKIGFEGLSGDWDAVIDTCGYLPGDVESAVRALGPRTRQYLFISTISVYRGEAGDSFDELDGQLIELEGSPTEVTAATYGGLKVQCERALRANFANPAIVRPGLIAGPRDYTDRWTYWPARIASEAKVLAGEPKDGPVQVIDVRDLAKFVVSIIEQSRSGIWNGTGPITPWAEFLAMCQAACPNPADIRWASTEFLAANGVAEWGDLPLWRSQPDPVLQIEPRRAREAGLTLRPLAETLRDTLAWKQTKPDWTQLATGLSPERQRELISLLETQTPA